MRISEQRTNTSRHQPHTTWTEQPKRNILPVNNRTPGTRDLQSQDIPLPGEPWKEASLNTPICKIPNIFGSHVVCSLEVNQYHFHRTNASKKSRKTKKFYWRPQIVSPTLKTMISVEVQTDAITARASEAFDYPFDGMTQFDIPTPQGIPDDYKIGLIVGPSGSGKTLLLNTFGTPTPIEWDSDKAICSHLHDFKTAVDMLSAVGLNSIPVWLKPYHVLSTGERARVLIARGLRSHAVFDEFTSTVDRATARSLAASIRVYADRHDVHHLTFASCHRDIIEWLAPDWTYDTLTQRTHLGRSVQQRQIIIEIHRCDWHCWRAFRQHHYLTHTIHKGAQCFIGTWLGVQVVFTAVLALPHPKIKNAFREHRTVVLPQFQGLSIGVAFSDAIASLYFRQGKRYYSRTIHPRMGQHRQLSSKWTPTATNLKKQTPHTDLTQISDHWQTDTRRTCFSHQYTG